MNFISKMLRLKFDFIYYFFDCLKNDPELALLQDVGDEPLIGLRISACSIVIICVGLTLVIYIHSRFVSSVRIRLWPTRETWLDNGCFGCIAGCSTRIRCA